MAHVARCREGNPVHETTYGESLTPGGAVVSAVAAAAGVDETDLPPLYDAVEPDALESLLEHDGAAAAGLTVSFDFGGWTVEATDAGEVRLYDPLD